MRVLLWIVQGVLALVFLVAGGCKLALPVDVLQEQLGLALPGLFLRFIGTLEVLGALGLILPGLCRVRPELTPHAAGGLVVLMVGAAMFTPPAAPLLALLPLGLAMLAALVVVGRWPQHARTQERAWRSTPSTPIS